MLVSLAGSASKLVSLASRAGVQWENDTEKASTPQIHLEPL